MNNLIKKIITKNANLTKIRDKNESSKNVKTFKEKT